MPADQDRDLSRREFVQGTVSGLALAAAPAAVYAAGGAKDADKAAVLAQVVPMHAENLRRLQEWIALPSIAAENRNFPQGPEYMAKLAKDAGFTGVKLIPTSGKPGVFGKIDARRAHHDGHLFHVRRETVHPRGVEFTAARGPLGAEAGSGDGMHGPRRGESKGAREFLSERAHGVQGGGQEIAGESRAGVRGRGGDRLAAFSRGDRKSRSAGRTQALRRGVHARSRPGSRRRRAGVARREGRGGTRVDLERREVGPRTGTRCAFEPRGAGGFALLASGPGAEHA